MGPRSTPTPSFFLQRALWLLGLSVLAAAFWLISANSLRAAPSAELWDRWTAHDAASSETIDHSAWDRFVKAYVSEHEDGVNRVAYGRVNRADRQALEDYIRGLTETSISRFNRDEQQAFWINLYNALTVKIVLDHYPVASIRDIDISPGFFSDGPWGAEIITVENEPVSLDDIEHRILRPIWRDPRIHYAVNCASIGCPNLLTRAVTAENAEGYLDEGARAYINDKRGAEVRGGDLIVSSIYDWFEADFGGNEAGVIAHLRRYADQDLAAKLAGITSISDDRYDWDLNDATPRKQSRRKVNAWPDRGS